LITRLSLRGPLLMTALALAIGAGCSDDSATDGGGGQGAEGGGNQPATGTGTTSTQPTTTTTTGSTSSSTGGGGGGTGGEGGGLPTDSGHQGSELVNAGDVCESQGYRLVYTLGQPTTNQQTMTSTGFRLQGGFVGATGSLQ